MSIVKNKLMMELFNIKLSGKFIFAITIFIFLFNPYPFDCQAQEEGITLKGKVLSVFRKKPMAFATITVFEIRKKTYSQKEGSYSIRLPRPGKYTIRITSPGLKPLQLTLNITKDTKKNFVLQATRIVGGALTISAERDIQKVSRHTLNVQDLKDTPATLGDPLNALTTLPSVNRSFGFFGQLVIRAMTGAVVPADLFEIDGMIMFYPTHFGGIHSVVALDLIKEIDLYASAQPAEFGHTIGAAINFNTIDSVKESGGFVSINLLSTNFEMHKPIDKKGGYIITAGRIGYLSVLVPIILDIMGTEVDQLPDYYDYQLKFKKFIDYKAKHSLHFLFLGAQDEWKFTMDEEKGIDDMPDDADPFNFAWKLRWKSGFNNFGLYYTYDPSKFFYFQQMFSISGNNYDYFIENHNMPSSLTGFGTVSRQLIYGLKNKIKIQWIEKISELRGGIEYLVFNFDSDLGQILPTGQNMQSMDLFRDGDFKLSKSKDKATNPALAGYLENKFEFGGLKFVPGIRAEIIKITGTAEKEEKETIKVNETLDPTFSPRGLLSFEFPSETTLAAAGGIYYNYSQTTPIWIRDVPEVGLMYYGKPEKSIHRVLSIEQKIELNTIRAEGFFNNLSDLLIIDQRDPNRLDKFGNPKKFRNTGASENYGFEIMIRRDRIKEKEDGFYGWLSYTYTHARFNNNLPELNISQSDLIAYGVLDPTGKTTAQIDQEVADFNKGDNKEFIHRFEISHSFKFVGGYTLGNHSFSLRYEYGTSQPYTPIAGDDGNPTPYTKKDEPRLRYAPVYGEKFSKKYQPNHRIDIRYAYKKRHEWGYVSWYLEAILITNQVKQEDWDYSQPYQEGVNPRMQKPDGTLPFLPLFGVEIKF